MHNPTWLNKVLNSGRQKPPLKLVQKQINADSVIGPFVFNKDDIDKLVFGSSGEITITMKNNTVLLYGKPNVIK